MPGQLSGQLQPIATCSEDCRGVRITAVAILEFVQCTDHSLSLPVSCLNYCLGKPTDWLRRWEPGVQGGRAIRTRDLLWLAVRQPGQDEKAPWERRVAYLVG
jgi:hypothetical protein